MNWHLYIGTYTQTLPFVDGQGQGIYHLEMDEVSGALGAPKLAVHAVNPSFLVTDPQQRWLFSVNELEQWRDRPSGAITAYAIQRPDWGLQRLNQRLSHGAAPCYLSTTTDGTCLLTANYVSGTVAALPIGPDGHLRPAASVHAHQGHGPIAARQEGAHAHSIQPDPSGRWAVAADLGADRLLVYRLAGGKLQPHGEIALHPGAGPRHFAFSSDGKFLFLGNELDATVTAFTWDSASGTLTHLHTLSTLPDGYTQTNLLADIHLHPSGRWLYASNRGHDSLAVLATSADSGITLLGHIFTLGRTPRNIALTQDGRFLIAANQDSHNLVVFRINEHTGLPEPTGLGASVPSPVCVVITFTPVEIP